MKNEILTKNLYREYLSDTILYISSLEDKIKELELSMKILQASNKALSDKLASRP